MQHLIDQANKTDECVELIKKWAN